ncbi:MAG: hypothetical protein CME06_18190 [Gemmatimonadetes bacterium]|nr:hypothetical protein [Gemmatimonadota bacterium]
MWFKRELRETLARLVDTRPVVVVTGPRQAGKTSLVRRAFPGYRYVSLDLPTLAAQAEDAPAEFLHRHPPPLIVDEVQYAPGLFRHLKREVDARRSRNGQFVLTGSQKFNLLQGVSDSLAGRTAILELEPLSCREILRGKPRVGLDDLLLRGGFPELQAVDGLRADEYFAAYVATYLERDLRSQLNVGNLRDFDRFLRACALRSGQLLNKSELARDIGISPTTANTWLSVLEASNQVVLLEPWFNNATRSMTKGPKLYLADTGLLCFLIDILSVDELHRSPLRGAIWETFVLIELRKRWRRARPAGRVHFWRDRQGEVDFLLHQGGRFQALEAKWSEHPSPRDGKGFERLERFLGAAALISRNIVCRTTEPFPIVAGLGAMGIHDAWFEGDQGADERRRD